MSQLSVVYVARAAPLVIKEIERHKPKPNELLVKTVAIASNPVDYKIVKFGLIFDFFPVTFGTDAVGIVEEVGENVKHFQKGDRVMAMCPAFGKVRNLRTGAFQQYVLYNEVTAVKIPDSISFEKAVTLLLGPATATIIFFHYFKLPRPASSERQPAGPESPVIFINGGSSSVGHASIQIARMLGYKIITTASPKNFDLLRKIGANELFDYHDPDWIAKVKEAAGSKPIHLVIDSITSAITIPLCYQIVTPPGKLALLNFIKKDAPPKDISVFPVWTGLFFEAAYYPLLTWWLNFLVEAVESGNFVALEPFVFGHSIADVPKLLEYHFESGHVSAVKPIILLDQ